MQKSALSNPFKWRSSYTRALALKLFIRERILRSKNINMTKAMHQYSTIRSTHNSFDDKSSIMSGLLPPRLLLVQVEFEVFGDVSGVYFTRYAKDMCEKLEIRGWIRVSPRGTVYGQIQGEKDKVDEMALWLRLQGSPGARIAHCEFKNWQIIDSCDFRSFSVRY